MRQICEESKAQVTLGRRRNAKILPWKHGDGFVGEMVIELCIYIYITIYIYNLTLQMGWFTGKTTGNYGFLWFLLSSIGVS